MTASFLVFVFFHFKSLSEVLLCDRPSEGVLGASEGQQGVGIAALPVKPLPVMLVSYVSASKQSLLLCF